jgi:hypothetical protein
VRRLSSKAGGQHKRQTQAVRAHCNPQLLPFSVFTAKRFLDSPRRDSLS